MSVKVEGLTKIYGSQRAVNEATFSAQPGQILGFLGPNGAGKTTTMKVITCFIPQTSGEVSVCGFDTASDPMEVRKRIGYLPEHNPLYKDMYVKEYLKFIAGLHKISNPQKRIAEMVEMTGLGREQHKLIQELSKGYRQRVGLAQAMMHDPDVLILDEPTSGLDPKQLIDIRGLIKELGKEKTVIFSTHIMQEVQAICDQVVIINKGDIVANDPIETLRQKVAGEKLITIEFANPFKNVKELTKIAGVKEAIPISDRKFQLKSGLEKDIRADIFRFAVEKKLVLLEMHQEVFTIEDVFLTLTKHSAN